MLCSGKALASAASTAGQPMLAVATYTKSITKHKSVIINIGSAIGEVGIPLRDHIIVAPGRVDYFSFRKEKMIASRFINREL